MLGRSRFVANVLIHRYSDFASNHKTRLEVPSDGHDVMNKTAKHLRDDEGRVGGGCEDTCSGGGGAC